jgi:glycerophosphoryl diester phosphodiesterase
MTTKLNISALIDDLGGAAKTAEIAGVVRTAPYGWKTRRYVSSFVLEKIKEARPDLNIDAYFLTEEQNENKNGGST